MLAAELFSLLEGTGDPAFATDNQQLICAWNRAAGRILGCTPSQVLGKRCDLIFQGQSALGINVCSEECSVMKCALRGQEISGFEMKVKTRSRGSIWVMASVLVFRDDRTSRHLVAHILHDINRSKQRETLNSRLIRLAQQIAAVPEIEESLPPAPSLSEKERTVLRLIAEGKSPGGAATDLGIADGTLRNYLSNINEKLGTHNRLEAIFQAKRRGII